MMNPASSLCISPRSTLREALAAIDAGKLEIAVAVDDSKKVVGVLTDGDIRRGLLRGMQLSDPVQGILSRTFFYASVRTSRNEVLDMMRSREIRQVPVLDEAGCLVGIHLMRALIGSVERPNEAVILAGGRGTRLRPVTDTIPKPMLPVAGRPILERLVLHLVGYGIRKFYIALHYKPEMITDHFGNGERFGCQIEYLLEEKPLGTGGALGLLKSRPAESLLVLNGDLVTQFDVGRFLSHHKSSRSVLSIGAIEHAYQVPFGVLRVEDGRVQSIEEKPVCTWLANSGIYAVSSNALDFVVPGEPMGMPDLAKRCIDEGLIVSVHQLEDDWIDVGQPDQLNQARKGF